MSDSPSEKPTPGPMNPPESWTGRVKFLGPGLILSAAIVGSGELIATTTLGARHGATLIWLILVACFFKVALQLEIGQTTILRGRPTLESWNLDPGPALFGVKWSVIAAFLFLLSLFVGMGGVLGGAAQIGFNVAPSVGVPGWTLLVVLLAILLLIHGRYRPVETTSVILNAVFVASAFFCLWQVQGTPFRLALADLAEGLLFTLPPDSVVLAFGVFGIVGVGAGEIAVYPYWCLEKGYGAWTGPEDGTEEWKARALGWIRVMRLDAVLSMGVYTAATVAFYLLGASVLSRQPALEDGNEFVLQLSGIFTEVLGQEASAFFLIGAFTILFSTVFANAAGFSRMWSDLLAVCRLLDRRSERKMKQATRLISCALPVIWGLTYLLFQQPLLMVIVMGLANTVFFLVIAVKVVESRLSRIAAGWSGSKGEDLFLAVSVLIVLSAGVRSLYEGFCSLLSLSGPY